MDGTEQLDPGTDMTRLLARRGTAEPVTEGSSTRAASRPRPGVDWWVRPAHRVPVLVLPPRRGATPGRHRVAARMVVIAAAPSVPTWFGRAVT